MSTFSGRPSGDYFSNGTQYQRSSQLAPGPTEDANRGGYNSINPGSTPMARPQPQSSSLNPSARSGSQLGQAHNQQQQAQARNPRQEGNTSPNQSRASTFFSSFRKNSTEDKGGYNEHGQQNNMNYPSDRDRPQSKGKLISARSPHNAGGNPAPFSSVSSVQSQPGAMSNSASSMGRRASMHLKSPLPTVVSNPQTGGNTIHPEIQQVVGLTLAHSSKIYCSGPLVRRIERNSDGSTSKDTQWVNVWAQLGGTTLSVWDMEAIRKASEEGREEPPAYINVTDSYVQILGSVTNAATAYSPEQKHSNVVTLNTAGSNLFLFACPTPQALVSWATALRLASWEKSRIEEIHTGHLFRLSMMDRDGQFREPQTTLVKGRLEGWAKVRVSGSTEWERLWVVVSTISSGPTGSLDAGTGRPGSPNSTLSKRNRLSSFLSGGNKNSQILSSDGSAIGSGPSITMYRTNKTKDRRRPLYTVTRVTQAFGVYPERPEIINQSTLFKLEALIKDEQTYSATGNAQRERGAGEPIEGWLMIIPELESAKPGSTEMLRWLIAIHDAFHLYGRPNGYIWDPRRPESMFFTYPYGPHRDHLFLDRELAEVLDPRIHETSRVRNLLTNILIQRLNGVQPAPRPPIQQPGNGPPPTQQIGNGANGPQLPPLNFNGNTGGANPNPNVNPSPNETAPNADAAGRNFNGDSVNPGRGRSALTTIREQSTFSSDSHSPPAPAPGLSPGMGENNQKPDQRNQYGPQGSIPQQPGQTPHGANLLPIPASPPEPAVSPSGVPLPISPPTITAEKRSWSPAVGSDRSRPQGSIPSPGTQSPAKLSIDINTRTSSPLSNRAGSAGARQGPNANMNVNAPGNHQQMGTIPSMHSTPGPSMHTASSGPNLSETSQPSQAQPTSWAPPNVPPPSSQIIPPSASGVNQSIYGSSTPQRPPASSPPPPSVSLTKPGGQDGQDGQLGDEAGALYMLSQIDDEPPEVSPLRDLPPQPLPPRLAALEKEKTEMAKRNAGEMSPYMNTSNAFGGGSGSSSTAGNGNVSGLSDVAPATVFNFPSGPQPHQPQFVQPPSHPVSAAVVQNDPRKRLQSHKASLGEQIEPAFFTASPSIMSHPSREEQEEEEHAANALAALTFVDSPNENTAGPSRSKNLSVPQSDALPASPSTSGSDSGHKQYQARSSFAPTAKSVERKSNAEAHQAAVHDSRAKPGRSKGKSNKGRAAWGSSDEEEEEEEEEESGDELPSSSKQETLKTPAILSPQPQPHPTHPNTLSELQYSNGTAGSAKPGTSRRLPAIPTSAPRSPHPQSPDSHRPQEQQHHHHQQQQQQHPYHTQSYSRPSSSDPHPQGRRLVEVTDEFGRRAPVDQGTASRQPTQPQAPAQTLPNRPVWSTVLDPHGEGQQKPVNRDTFVQLEPNETMTMAFTPQGLLQAGMQDKQSRSAKQQEAHAREIGASLVNVPTAPPPPQMGLVGAITAHQRDRERDGGVGATLTERERERRLAEERQRKYDELQRLNLDKMDQQGTNSMMMNPMMGWGMPMMYPMGMGMGMGGMGNMGNMGWGAGMTPQQQQQQQQQQYQMWAAQQAAMQAYQQAMISFSQAGSQAPSEAGGHAEQPTGRQGASSPLPGWGGGGGGGGMPPMGSPMMTPMMMPGMMPGMGMMPPAMMPGFGMGGSQFMQSPAGLSPQQIPQDGAGRPSNINSPNLSPLNPPSMEHSRAASRENHPS